MPDLEPKAAITIRGGMEFASRFVDPPQKNLFVVGSKRRNLAREVSGESLIPG